MEWFRGFSVGLGFQPNKPFSERVMYRHFGHWGCKIWVFLASYLSNSHICELAVILITIFKILHFPPQTLYTVFLYIDDCDLDCADDAFCSTDDALFIKHINISLLRAANYQSSDNVWPKLAKIIVPVVRHDD